MQPSSVAVLMCATDDTRFVFEQLKSISEQKNADCRISISLDGDVALTKPKHLEMCQTLFDQGCSEYLEGPKQGFAYNFLSIVMNTQLEADYFAFSDQDDIWEKDKLSVATEKLSEIPEGKPALYCSRTRLVDEANNEVGFSTLFKKLPSFKNALVQSISGGNTMVMNKAAFELLRKAGSKKIVSHDWWAYLLVTGAGGAVLYDTYPSVRYRQHEGNLWGANNNLFARCKRIFLLFYGLFRKWNEVNVQLLEDARYLLISENQEVLSCFSKARKSWLFLRCQKILQSGIFRQTWGGNIGLIIATIFKKI